MKARKTRTAADTKERAQRVKAFPDAWPQASMKSFRWGLSPASCSIIATMSEMAAL